jgi:hypothetical protein
MVTSVKHLYDDEGFYTDDPESAHHVRNEAFAVNDVTERSALAVVHHAGPCEDWWSQASMDIYRAPDDHRR